MVRVGLGILIAAGLFWPLAGWIHDTLRPSDQEIAATSEAIIERFRHLCLPEPGERVAFLVGCALLPGIVVAWDASWKKSSARWSFEPPRLAKGLLGLAMSIVLVGFCFWALSGEGFFHAQRVWPEQSWYWVAPFAAAVIAAVACGIDRRVWVRVLLHVAVVAVIGMVATSHVFDETYWYASNAHFNATFAPVVQVHLGKVLLVDSNSQYGLYPHFLQPVFALTGLTVRSFTIVMGLLTAASLTALWTFLCGATQRRLVAAIGFVSLVANTWVFLLRSAKGDLYFQYFPLRFLVPSFVVLLAARYACKPGPGLYWATTALASAGVLWNLDSGAPALLTWISFLVYCEGADAGWKSALRKAPRHAAAGAVTLLAVLGTYSLGAFLTSGQWPAFGQMLAYQNLFYRAGFCMLPMPLPGAWMIVAVVYLSGLAYAMRATHPPRSKNVLLLSVLGVGLLPYYQGRSHEHVLILVWWPAILLLAIYIDDFLERLESGVRCPLAWTASGLASFTLIGSSCGFIAEDRAYVSELIAARWSETLAEDRSPADDVAMLREHLRAGEPLYALSEVDGLIHLGAGRQSLSPLTFSQTLLESDAAGVAQRLREAPDATVFVQNGLMWGGTTAESIVAALLDQYEFVASTPHGLIFRKTQSDSLLARDRSELGRCSIAVPLGSDGLDLPSLAASAPYAVELIVRPDKTQQAFATLVSNHPGTSPTSTAGFTVHREPGERDVYALVVGDGTTWAVASRFELQTDVWNHVVLNFDESSVTAHVNGQEQTELSARPIRIQPSDLPVTIGNWISRDRRFAGEVREARFLGRILRPDEIEATVRSMQTRLGTGTDFSGRLAGRASLGVER